MSSPSERYARIHEILTHARSLTGADLESYLETACGNDEALRSDVQSLLEAGHDDNTRDPFGEKQRKSIRDALEGVVESTDADWLPDKIADYSIKKQIGSGGMGVVYEAEQASPRRKVAIKLLHPMLASSEALSRFHREAELLGRLQHPGIAQIFEAATYDAGRGPQPFFAMELVDGVPLTEYAETHAVGVTGRLELIAQLCDAVQYAHQKGVIHRDLKPANILVTDKESSVQHAVGADNTTVARVKVLDFGVARATNSDLTASTRQTVEGQLVGTLAYMSPEQASGDPTEIDEASDVYALGVLAYELLAGQLPLSPHGKLIHDAVRAIREDDPSSLGTIDANLRGDIETIVAKALAKDKAQRYESAAELAADIRRHLQDVPIVARPPSRTYLIRKFTRRNKALVGGVVATLVVAIAGAISATGYALEANRNAQSANNAALREELRAKELLQLSDLQDLDDLIAQANTLWPSHPEHLTAYEQWIEIAEELKSHLPKHRAKRDELRAQARPRTSAERESERLRHPRFAELTLLTERLESLRRAQAVRDGTRAAQKVVLEEGLQLDMADLLTETHAYVMTGRRLYGLEGRGLALAQQAVKQASGADISHSNTFLAMAYFANGLDEEARDAIAVARDAAEETGTIKMLGPRLDKLEAEIEAAQDGEPLATLEVEQAALSELVSERREFHFEEGLGEVRWWEKQLTELIAGVEDLTKAETGLLSNGISNSHGAGILRRRNVAAELRAGFDPGGIWHTRWVNALPEIEEAYPGLGLMLQMGLVPIGADPQSGLWEFWHIQTGEEPQRAHRHEGGKLIISDESGVVLVLLPAGKFTMGAQSRSADAPNYDKDASVSESPTHEVKLSSFFMSKYELTQAQWERFTGNNPSQYQTGIELSLSTTPRNPVESIGWLQCTEALDRMGLSLPSEAQWEYAGRGGSAGRFSCAEEDLSLYMNLAEQAYANTYREQNIPESWNDGFPAHAPVGSFLPNAFGFHDMHGNVWEWCRDGHNSGEWYTSTPKTNPVRDPAGTTHRRRRGGSYNGVRKLQRITIRYENAPSFAMNGLGVRPSRMIE